MKEEIKQAAEIIISHPKTALAVTGMANFNAWYGTYEPIAKFATSLLGIVLVCVLIIKHSLDIKKTLKNKDN